MFQAADALWTGHNPETLFSDVFNTRKQLMCIPQDITAAPFCVGEREREATLNQNGF